MMAKGVTSTRIRRAWGRVRWKITAIILFTGTSTILIACLAVAALNVVVRRESANVVEKQIEVMVETSRSVASAMLDNAGYCTVSPANSGFKQLLAYTDEAFPQAEASLIVDGPQGASKGTIGPDFAGLVVDGGRLEIRNVMTRQTGSCRMTATFSLPLGTELAERLSSASGMQVTPVLPRPFRVRSPNQRFLRTIEGNFLPGVSRRAAVVLTARNDETGKFEDWIAYIVRPGYLTTFEGVVRSGSQLANWVLPGALLALMVFILETAGVWMCIRLGSNIATSIDDLSGAARQIARGNFAWRTPVRDNDQLGDLSGSFNEMAIALERLKREESVALRIESELQVARSVQEYLFPRVAPVLRGVTISGRTLAARAVGGDLYDFFDLGRDRLGILCVDVSGKGIPAALMMANLQAVARAHFAGRNGNPSPGHFVEVVNQELTGRFGDNRYASLFWAEYNAHTSALAYVNAGHPSPILIRSGGQIDRLDSDNVPVGMFANARYTAGELQMKPGNRLVIFTDGLTDAQNAAGEEFGDERLIACCRTIAPEMDAKASAETLMQTVSDWSVGTEQFDDTTVVVIDIAPSTAAA